MSKRARDAEEIKRKKETKARFRKLVRAVILNSTWLMDSGDQKISLNVKKNIAMLVRTQRKIGLLTVAEKSLLRTPHWIRTVAERKKLCILLAGLTCFSRIPPKIRARLVPVIKFMVLNPGRVIMKENDFPMTVYFILTGEVEMTKTVFDKMTRKPVQKSEAIFGPGDCIGDIEMVEDCLRRNTYVAISQCELLVVFDTDFIEILGPYMSKQWAELKKAIKSLDYFNFLSDKQVISACTYAQLRQFDPLETICYEDKGSVSYVYFVVSGECEILQCLNMKVTQKGPVKTFELEDLKSSTMVFQNLSKEEARKMMREEEDKLNLNIISELDDESEDENRDEATMKKKTVKKWDLKTIEINCGLRKPVLFEGQDNKVWPFEDMDEGEQEVETELERLGPDGIVEEQSSGFQEFDPSSEMLLESEIEPISQTDSMIETKDTSSLGKRKKAEEVIVKRESHFIDVGSLTFGGIFGLGEKLEHRVIMARTTVQCLMLPRFWLFEKNQNPGNVWQRRRFYLDCTIPSREILFKDFLKTRKWQKFKHDFIQSNLDQNQKSNDTKIDDIPIICRIVEPQAQQ